MIGALALLLCLQAVPSRIARIQVEGSFVEPLSHVAFLEQVGSWVRTAVLKYPAPPSSNYSMTYELRRAAGSVRARATCYVFSDEPPIPGELDAHFQASLEELGRLRARSDSELLNRDSMTFGEPGHELDTRWAAVLLRRGIGDYHEPVVSQIFLLKNGAYWVKWRITSPVAEENDVAQQILNLIEALLPRA